MKQDNLNPSTLRPAASDITKTGIESEPKKVITVSNRLPVSVIRTETGLSLQSSAGGLATAMSSIEGSAQNVWIGWPGIATDDTTPKERAYITTELKKMGMIPVFLTKQQVELFYEGYSNETIWPLFHYFLQYTQHEQTYWEAYQEVNAAFCEVVAAHAKGDSMVWVHDYHLMLLPQLLRATRADMSIGFFLHIPFPSYEVFRILPQGARILRGLLGANLIGFHTYDYVRHFTSSVLRMLGHEGHLGSIAHNGHTTAVDVFPIGIDYQKFAKASASKVVATEAKRIKQHYGEQKLLVSVDRVDYSKGILQRLEAFAQFLSIHPEYRQKISMLMIAVPSRTGVDAYMQLRDQIEQTVSRINGLYSTVDWTPISYQYRSIPFNQLVALYKVADMALVTPLRDGMNLVAKEYIACKEHDDGVLILSELTGAVSELPEAVQVNPNDIESIANAMFDALNMPSEEQRRRLRAMQARISKYTVKRWAEDFLEQLQINHDRQIEKARQHLNEPARQKLVERYVQAKNRLLLLDYDGTLAPFVNSPESSKAQPTELLLGILERLANNPNNQIVLVSGRKKTTLAKWFTGAPYDLIAEHGGWTRKNGIWRQQKNNFETWQRVLLPTLEQYAERTPGAAIEIKDHALVWHYRNVSPELAFVRNARLRHDLKKMTESSSVGVYSGNKIIEIKCHQTNKGVAVERLLKTSTPDFILCVGDDYTDEDMFKVLPRSAHTIKVGPGTTLAKYRLANVKAVHALIELLATT